MCSVFTGEMSGVSSESALNLLASCVQGFGILELFAALRSIVINKVSVLLVAMIQGVLISAGAGVSFVNWGFISLILLFMVTSSFSKFDPSEFTTEIMKSLNSLNSVWRSFIEVDCSVGLWEEFTVMATGAPAVSSFSLCAILMCTLRPLLFLKTFFVSLHSGFIKEGLISNFSNSSKF